jgi:methylmalonyl-CoA decarboxylase subunit alpha
MAQESLLAEYEARRAKALAGGGADKYAKRTTKGILNARERIAKLVDASSFIESGLFGTSAVEPHLADETQTDGKIAGYAKIGGRDVAIVVNDFTVKGASTSYTNGRKVGHMKRTATERGMPLVCLGESTGARLPDAMGGYGMGMLLGNDNTQFRRTRETPMVAAAFGPSFGSSTWMMCISDFAVMHKGATVAVSSPGLVSMALGQKVTAEELGGWRLHSDITGLVDQAVDTEEEVLEAIKKFLSYMPSHHNEAPPEAPIPAGSGAEMDKVFGMLPESRTQVYDMKRIIRCVVDKDSMFELKPRFGKSAVTTLARLGGKSVGCQQPIASRRRARRRCVPQDRGFFGDVRFVQRADRAAGRYAGLPDRHRSRKSRRARAHHEFHERHDAAHRTAFIRDHSQELRPRLCVHGRRAPLGRHRRLAQRGNQLHESGVRYQDRARRGLRRAGL